jgi:Laminin G domain
VRRLTWLAPVLAFALVAVVACEPAEAAATVRLADWQMNEPAGSRTMVDSSGNGSNGSVGSSIQTGVTYAGATGYRWSSTNPNGYPAKPERLVTVPDDRLNPGSRDYAVTVRFRTTHSYGNMIQKGQSETPGGYFKWQIPSGRLMCLYRSRDSRGNLLGQKAVTAPVPLNDGAWHTVRCEKTADRVTMTIDGTTVVRSSRGTIGPIANTMPLSIAGKVACDQVRVTCDYFAGDIDWVRIEASSP